MFDRISPTYDLLNRLLSLGIDRRWRTRALDVLAARVPEGALLDSCAGTLDLSAAMERRWPERALIAADFARDMLLAGRAKLQAARARAAVRRDAPAVRGRARSPGMTCGFGMRNLSDPRRGVAEAARVLAPGGVFVVLEFFRPTRAADAAVPRGLRPRSVAAGRAPGLRRRPTPTAICRARCAGF